jgi:hypothetical protein
VLFLDNKTGRLEACAPREFRGGTDELPELWNQGKSEGQILSALRSQSCHGGERSATRSIADSRRHNVLPQRPSDGAVVDGMSTLRADSAERRADHAETIIREKNKSC